MKPAPFTLHTPRTLDDAARILNAVAHEDGRVLAGGQTLCPAMALRLARPTHLIDINRIDELSRVRIDGDPMTGGSVTIGAVVRHAAMHKPDLPGPLARLMAAVVRHIAHLPIRHRGTLCGSLANADAASEWCLVAATLDATLTAVSVRGRREIPAAGFFLGFMTTALEPDEILVSVRLPLLADDARFGFQEFSRRAGDFAQAMALGVYRVERGVIAGARVGVGGVEPASRRIPEAEAALNGREPSAAVFAEAAGQAAQAVLPVEDDEDGVAYKRDLVRAAVLRALQDTL